MKRFRSPDYMPRHKDLGPGKHRPDRVDMEQSPQPSIASQQRALQNIEVGSEAHLQTRAGRIATRRQIEVSRQASSLVAQETFGDNSMQVAHYTRVDAELQDFDAGILPIEAMRTYFHESN